MPLTMALYDSVLKDLYEGSIREQLNSEVPLFKHLEESEKEWAGRRVVFPIHTTRNSGVGARAEGGTLPAAGNQGHSLAIVSATYQYARGAINGPAIAAGKNAFAAALSMEMDGLMSDLKVDLGRQTWGYGDGRMAQVGADGASSTSISVYNRFFEPGQNGGRYINQGAILDMGTVAAPTGQVSSATVISVAVSTTSATTVDTVTTSLSTVTVSQCETYLFTMGAGGVGVECLGVQAIVDVFTQANIFGSNAFYGSSIQGIARDNVAAWNANVFGNSGVARVIDSNLLETVFNQISIDTGEDPDMIIGHHSVVRALLDSLAADRRYVSPGTAPKYDAGHGGISYNGVPIETDRMGTYNQLLVFQKKALKKYTLKPIGFADEDGKILKQVEGIDRWQFWLCTYFNLGCDGNMKGLAMIRDIQTDF